MKIIISPAKTKKLEGNGNGNKYCDKIGQIVAKILELDLDTFAKKMKLKEDKAKALYEFYKNFDSSPEGMAVLSYKGAVLKEAKIGSEDLDYLGNHLYILSALYGILEPCDSIKEYRLDFDNNIIPKDFWKEIVNDKLKDELIINLASKEYFNQIDLPMIEICFTSKMQIKKARGQFLRILIDNKVETLEDLKKLESFSHNEGNKFYFNI